LKKVVGEATGSLAEAAVPMMTVRMNAMMDFINE
jgi:hypothetical protein